MFERFTDKARSSVVLAQEQARRLNHGYIGTEHLLLGLLAESEGLAARVLSEIGVRASDVEADIDQMIGRGEDEASAGQIPFTPRAKKVLELSLREALQLGHNYIGTEHILLGIIREGEGVAAQISPSAEASPSKRSASVWSPNCEKTALRRDSRLAHLPRRMSSRLPKASPATPQLGAIISWARSHVQRAAWQRVPGRTRDRL